MVFERIIGGIEIMLRIDNYRSPSIQGFENSWCDCGYSFRLEDVIHYHKDHDEILMSEEVDELADAFTDLINGKIEAPQELSMTEPDFSFLLYPIKDLRTDPKYTYIAPGYEMQDIYAEWRIFFWDGGITDNFLSITLDREDIIPFRDFLNSCRKESN